MNITYRQLAAMIAAMPEDRKDDTATVVLVDSGEVFGVEDAGVKEDLLDDDEYGGIVDDGHLVMLISA